MTWENYIEHMILYSRDTHEAAHIDKGCILGMEDCQLWTTKESPDILKLLPNEISAIADCFRRKDFANFKMSGVYIGGVKYQFLKVDDNKVVYAKKKGFGGVTLQATKTSVLVGHCPEGSQQGNCNNAVARVADYLENLEY